MPINAPQRRTLNILSWFCLIPAFGILIGAGLLIYISFRYRNGPLYRRILLCMAGSFILIKLDMAYMENRFKNEEKNGMLAGQISGGFLNSIVDALQRYKMKYGNYPDSLVRLEQDNPYLLINDPIFARKRKMNKSDNYYYKRTAKSYILFSLGQDSIPFTEDDIYPDSMHMVIQKNPLKSLIPYLQ